MKCVPSTATIVGSPRHCWFWSSFGSPMRSVNVAPPSLEYPTPVPEPSNVVGIEPVRNAVASFQATSTRWPDAATAVSDCPAPRSRDGSFASTFMPRPGANVMVRSGSSPEAAGGFTQARSPWE